MEEMGNELLGTLKTTHSWDLDHMHMRDCMHAQKRPEKAPVSYLEVIQAG